MAIVTTSSELPPANRAPSTAGITTKVVKGSIWTLVGQVAPLGVSLLTTPFVIRFLGAESYGVLILVGLIQTYLGFSDFGMNLASTKFASEAFAEGDLEKEAGIVRTAAVITVVSSAPFALCLFAFSYQIISLFEVPENLRSEASIALKFASVTFVINFLNGIFNTPELTRLRMDLNTLVNAGFRIVGLIATPFAVYYGGVIAAVLVLLAVAVVTLLGHIAVSERLGSRLFKLSVERSMIRPMLKFGAAIVGLGTAGVLLINAEKGIVAATVSAKALAIYSVGFTLASMMVLFSTTLTQSLVPAFSQLSNSQTTSQLEALFSRIVRLSLIVLIPSSAFLCLIARDFFLIWAGEEFARESTMPFYILLFGLLFSVPGYVPYSFLMSTGRANAVAKLYWVELVPYLIIVFLLTNRFGIVGAAVAWSLRVAFDGIIFFLLAKRGSGVNLKVFQKKTLWILVGALVVLPSLLTTIFWEGAKTWQLFPLYLISIIAYSSIVWNLSLSPEEKHWAKVKITSFWLRPTKST